jgi:hypothetical protein
MNGCSIVAQRLIAGRTRKAIYEVAALQLFLMCAQHILRSYGSKVPCSYTPGVQWSEEPRSRVTDGPEGSIT